MMPKSPHVQLMKTGKERLAGLSSSSRLVCFAHAGGSTTAFRGWAEVPPPSVATYAVQYPGRADCAEVPMPSSLQGVADLLVPELSGLVEQPLMLLGHSFGAALAYLCARQLRLCHPGARLSLLLCAPPLPAQPSRALHRLPDDELWELLTELGGIEPQLHDSATLRRQILPLTRADLKLLEIYAWPPDPPLDCPVTVHWSPEDPLASSHIPSAWQALCSGPYAQRRHPGGHFFLHERPEKVLFESPGMSFSSGGSEHA
ncbi:thioesterase [Streptomyces sp. b94]|uniref:thioesterase II family protein n=1 Tax=Streptomyces sp. b94 TaxID=1827634 RepID=UPI001B35EC87|nr:alpha/beta fold hydrolase [Streptomyces sp. b94]MBQ1101097.1 thioesterase [Streptomyces sp. b94]